MGQKSLASHKATRGPQKAALRGVHTAEFPTHCSQGATLQRPRHAALRVHTAEFPTHCSKGATPQSKAHFHFHQHEARGPARHRLEGQEEGKNTAYTERRFSPTYLYHLDIFLHF